MNQPNEVPALIKMKVAEALPILAPHLQNWLRPHLVEPRLIRLSADADGTSFKDLWLVTDHTGEEDSSYRLVYDGDNHEFGLESTLDTGVEWYMGSYGSFSETVESM
jgi:hypothetical protein